MCSCKEVVNASDHQTNYERLYFLLKNGVACEKPNYAPVHAKNNL